MTPSQTTGAVVAVGGFLLACWSMYWFANLFERHPETWTDTASELALCGLQCAFAIVVMIIGVGIATF